MKSGEPLPAQRFWVGFFFIVSFSVIFSLLTACNIGSLGPDIPTLIPSDYVPTAIALTARALSAKTVTPSQSPTATTSLADNTPTIVPSSTPKSPTKTETERLLRSTATKTETQTPTPVVAVEIITQNSAAPTSPSSNPNSTPLPPIEIPYATIQIIRPGPLSKVISPIELHAFLVPGAGGRVRVELLGEDERLMVRKLLVYETPPDVQVHVYIDLDYEIVGVAETARLSVSVDDDFGRTKAIASEELILLSMGNPDLNPPGDLLETIVIQQPTDNSLIQGGNLTISGLVRPASEKPLYVELVNQQGKVVGYRLAAVSPTDESGYRLFSAEVPYDVSSYTRVRLVVSEQGRRLSEKIHLSSVEVSLSP